MRIHFINPEQVRMTMRKAMKRSVIYCAFIGLAVTVSGCGGGGGGGSTSLLAPQPGHVGRMIDGGGAHTCALNDSGGIKCWGFNGDGQLGDGTTTDRETPLSVTGLTSGADFVASGGSHSCAVTSSGGVKCWGFNGDGQLGDGTTTQRLLPVDVSGLTSGVATVAAGVNHSCALTTAGGVKCWGDNQYGQLGDGTTTDRTTPVDVSGLSSGVASITVGDAHTCAVTTAGGVKCWGYNGDGQLGDGTTVNKSSPTDVSGLASGISNASAGGEHTCALTASGGLKCWGHNNFAQLGDGTITDRTTPADVSGLTTGASAVTAGKYHTCALTAAGGVKCWGDNQSGQLGDGTTTYRPTPVNVSGLTSGISSVGAGDLHTCALTTAGNVKCWGDNQHGQIGTRAQADGTAPVGVSGLTSGVTSVAAGFSYSCSSDTDGGMKCWGKNVFGQIGDGTTNNRAAPAPVSGLAYGVTAIAAGGERTCAIVYPSGLKCWGNNYYGQVGDGTTTSKSSPANVSGLSSGVSKVATGNLHTCALTTAGGVKCWGDNSFGQLGDGTTTRRTTPVDVSGLTSGVTAIAAGNFQTCALTAAGGVKCWGWNNYGQVGDGTTTERHTPVDVSGLTSGVTTIAAGVFHTCAVTASGGMKCWGDNSYGQLGDGTTTARLTPVDVSGLASGVSKISSGYYHTCAITASGGAKCWGDNSYGQLGDGTTTARLTPVDVSGLTTSVASIAAGGEHTCAATSAGAAKCWGNNHYGQLGINTVEYNTTPVDITGF